MKKVVFLSGKGGVGKTSITASCASMLKEEYELICVDADVDTPNLHLLLKPEEELWKEKISVHEKPVIDYDKCTGCKECYDNCEFNAIKWEDEKPVVNDLICEGCKVCSLMCEEDAISLVNRDSGEAKKVRTEKGINLLYADLNMGETGSGKLVDELKLRGAEEGADLMLLDAPAGIGCPVISACKGVDFAFLILEPTRASFTDMKRAWELLNHFNINCGLIMNKFDLNPEFINVVKDFASSKGVEDVILVPFDERFTNCLNELKIVSDEVEELKEYFNEIVDVMKKNL